MISVCFFFQAEDGIRDLVRSRGLGDVYKRQAQESGYLSINDVSSKFLGKHWTTCTDEQENKITIRNQLTMTTGLNDGVSDNHCLVDSCLNYIADAGTRWAYHNAPYTLLEKVLTNATGQNINLFTANKLKNLTGISGSWFTIDYDLSLIHISEPTRPY